MSEEEFKKEVEKNITNLFNKANIEEKILLNNMINTINDLCKEKQELINYLKEKIKILEPNDCVDEISRWCSLERLTVYKEILSKVEKSNK